MAGYVCLIVLLMLLMAHNNPGLRLVTYNCRGYNKSKRSYLTSLLNNCDFLLLQEHWLSDGQLGLLETLSYSHLATAVSGFGSSEILRGRPYGGCAIFWPRRLCANVEVIDTHSNRLCALHLTNEQINVVLISVYMPCESTSVAIDEFCTVLAQILHITDSFQDASVVIGGDFNTDFSRNTEYSTFRHNFCQSNNLHPVINHQTCSVDYTYNFCMERFSTIDQFIISSHEFSKVLCYDVVHEIDNCSDHDPVRLVLSSEWACPPNVTDPRTFHSKPSWM